MAAAGGARGEEPVAPASGDLPPAPAAVSGAPVQTLNELAQAGYVTDLAWQSAAKGNAPAVTLAACRLVQRAAS